MHYNDYFHPTAEELEFERESEKAYEIYRGLGLHDAHVVRYEYVQMGIFPF